MPTESINLKSLIGHFPICYWLQRGKERFCLLEWQGNTEMLMSTHPNNPAILQTMVDMITSAEHSVYLSLDVESSGY